MNPRTNEISTTKIVPIYIRTTDLLMYLGQVYINEYGYFPF
jgi:hypothetical protein